MCVAGSGVQLAQHDKTRQVEHLRRNGALRRKLTRTGMSGLLVTHLPDLRYLCGFTGSSAVLAVTRRAARMFTDGRFIAQAKAEVQGAHVEVVTRAPAVAAVEWLAAQLGSQPASQQDQFAGFDPAYTTVADLHRWKAALPAKLRRSFLTPIAAPLVEPLRLVKDQDELRIMREAALLGCRLFDHMLDYLRPGLREIEVAAELEHKARLLGAEGMSFDTIVASGQRSALPHGHATQTRLPRRGFLTLDFGIIHDGYCSDMTRTVYFGSPRPEERSAYQAVLEAQEAAVAAVSAGAMCCR